MGCSPKDVKNKILTRLRRGDANITELSAATVRWCPERRLCHRYTIRILAGELEIEGLVESEKAGRERIYRLKKSRK